MSRGRHFGLFLLAGLLTLAGARAATAQTLVVTDQKLGPSPINNEIDPVQPAGLIGNTNYHTFNVTNTSPDIATISDCSATNGFGIPGLPTEGQAPIMLMSGQTSSFSLTLDVNLPGTYATTVSCPGTFNFTFGATWQMLSQSPTAGVSAGSINFNNPGSFSFPSTTAGSSSVQAFTVTNLSTQSLNVSNIAVTGTGFSTGTVSLTIASGQSAGFNVTFAPPAGTSGPLAGELVLTSNDSHSPFVINLSGTAVAAPTSQVQVTDKTTGQSVSSSGSPVSLGTTSTGTTLTNVFSLTNTGSASLTVTSATVSGTGYTMTVPSSPLAAGASTKFTVTYTATSTGQFAGTVNLYTNAPGSPFSFGVSTTVSTPPTATYKVFSSVSATPLNNGGTIDLEGAPGDPPYTFQVYVQNTGSTAITLSGEGLSSTTGFYEAGPFISTLDAGATANSECYISTSTAGVASGTLTFEINGALFTILLTDNVPAPEPSMSVAWNATGQIIMNGNSYTFTSTPAGTPTSEVFNVSDVGGAALDFTPSVSSPQGCFVLLTPGAATATNGSPVAERVRLISSTPLTCTGTVTLTTNDPTQPSFSFDLTGTVTGSTPEPSMQVTWNATGATINNGGTYAFNSTTVGVATSEVFNVANTGAAALAITSATISSPQGCFALISPLLPSSVPAPTTADPDPLAQARIRLSSTTAESCTGTVTLVTNDPTNPTFTFNLDGTVSN